MSTPAPHHQPPIRTASGIFDDVELYPDQLVIRHRDILSRLREQAEVLELSDIESIKITPKRADHSTWISMKILCHKHKPVEICYRPAERPQMRELNILLIEMMSAEVQKQHD